MDYLLTQCSICNENRSDLYSLSNKSPNGLIYFEKLLSCFSEMDFIGFTSNNLICSQCQHDINYLYSFKEKCLRSKNRFFNVQKRSFVTNEVLQFNVISVKAEKSDTEMNISELIDEKSNISEEIIIKSEPNLFDLSSEEIESDEDNEDSRTNFDSLSEQSKKRYRNQYEMLKDWSKKNNIMEYNEQNLFIYFQEIASKKKSSSLWSMYSMLKATLIINNNVDIGNFKSLTKFIKQKSLDYKPKKSNVLTRNDIIKFLIDAPDELYLMTKVALIIGIACGYKRSDFTEVTIDSIEDQGTHLVIKMPDNKSGKLKTYTISNSFDHSIDILYFYRKYLHLRPQFTKTNRFFLKYSNGKCSNQVVGINTFGKMPKIIAQFLNLSDPDSYTAHCFRTSAKLLFTTERGDINVSM